MSSSQYTWASFRKNYPILCRPALPKDTPDVMELTRTIWEGQDYVPAVWGEWLQDPEGLLAVAESGGRVVGTSKLSRFTPRDWWLEGLRVHPDFQGSGVASHLHDYLLEYWLRSGQGTLRLATASTRLPVRHLAERTGLSKVAEFTTFIAQVTEEENLQFTNLDPGDVSEALEFAYQSQTFSLSNYLMDLGWQWTAPDEGLILDAARSQAAWWWRGRRGLLVAWEDRESQLPRLLISIVACQVDDLVELLADYRKLAQNAGFSEAGWSAPLNQQLTSLLAQAGFSREWDGAVYVYARQHSDPTAGE
jgi:GNAT superfamily N-acetyltransferase